MFCGAERVKFYLIDKESYKLHFLNLRKKNLAPRKNSLFISLSSGIFDVEVGP